jgi:hypothetical protein
MEPNTSEHKERQKAWNKSYYQKNKEKYAGYRDKRRRMLQTKIYEYKKAHPCACGETDPVALSFDHDDPNLREYDVTAMANAGFSWAHIMTEVAKCTVRCFNCHMKLTAKQQNWYNWLEIQT